MSKSFTYNIVLTKSKEVAGKLFFTQSITGNTVNTRRLSTIFTGLTDNEKKDTLIVSPFSDVGFISLINEFPGGGKPRFITMKFIESVELLENFLIPSNAQEELVTNRFKKRINNLSQLTPDLLDILKKFRPRFYLAYGIGDDVSEWAGPLAIELSDANLSITSDGVRELELGFMPTQETVKVFTNRQFIDQDLAQGQSIFDTTRATSDLLESRASLDFKLVNQLPVMTASLDDPKRQVRAIITQPSSIDENPGPRLADQNFDGDTWNFAIRRLIREYLSVKYQSLPKGNILVLFNQDLDKPASDKDAAFNRKGSKDQSFVQLYRDTLAEYGISVSFPMKRVGPTQTPEDKSKADIIARNSVQIAIKRARLEEINEIFNRAASREAVNEGRPRQDIPLSIEAEKLVKDIEFLEGQINVVRAETPDPVESNEEEDFSSRGPVFIKNQILLNESRPAKISDKAMRGNPDFNIEIEGTLSDFELFGRQPEVTLSFRVDHKTSEIDNNILESLKPFYKFFSKLKTKIDTAFDPIIFEENDMRITTTLFQNKLIEDKNSPVVVIGDRTLIRDLMYGHSKSLPIIGKALSYGGFNVIPPPVLDGPLPSLIPPVNEVLSKTPSELQEHWSNYRKEIISVLYDKKNRTSSFKETIDFGPYKGFSNSITDESLVFMHNLKNSNVIDVSFDASPYKGELLNVQNESIYGLLDQALEGNQDLLDNTLKLRAFEYLAKFVKDQGVNPDDLVEVVNLFRNNLSKVEWTIRKAGLDKLPAFDFIELLIFKLNGNDFSDVIRKNRPGQTAKVAADTLRKVSSYILSVNLKTLPFFSTVDFLGRKCVLVGAPNKIIGSKVNSPRDSIPAPSVFSNGYYIFGYKHVITARDAYSEFTLYQHGLGDFASDAIKKTTADLLGIENNSNKSVNVKIPDQDQGGLDRKQQDMVRVQQKTPFSPGGF